MKNHYKTFTHQVDYSAHCNRQVHIVRHNVPKNLFYFSITDKNRNDIMSGQAYLVTTYVRDFFANLLLSLDIAFCCTITYKGHIICDIYRSKEDAHQALSVNFTDELKEMFPDEYEDLPF